MTEKVGGAGSESPKQAIEYIFHTFVREESTGGSSYYIQCR